MRRRTKRMAIAVLKKRVPKVKSIAPAAPAKKQSNDKKSKQ